MKQEKIHYYFQLPFQNDDVKIFNHWVRQTFQIMENVTQKQLSRDVNIIVSPNFNYPQSWGNESPIRINLAMSSLLFWSQEVYQLAHEYCHVLINSPYNPQMRDEWFEEVICECASRFVLSKMNDDDYAKQNYTDSFINYEKGLFNEKVFKFKKNALSNENSVILTRLRQNHEWREPQKYLANMIYPLIAEDGAFWQSIIRLADFKNENTFMENLSDWYQKSPAPSKQQISKIIELFQQ